MTLVTELFGNEAEVTEEDGTAIVDGILSAYPPHQRNFFYLRLRQKWGLVVADEVIATDGSTPGKIVVSTIYDFARANGRALDLLAVVWTDRPHNPKLAALAARLLEYPNEIVAKYADSGPTDVRSVSHPSLEKLVENRSRLVSMPAFIESMARLSGALCRIRIPEVSGTGFLIGRKTVLTNFHVVRNAISARRSGDQISCEFDYHDSRSEGVIYNGKSDFDWLGSSSPYSESDLSGSGDPAENELDFAVIHLSEEVEIEREAIVMPQTPPIVSQRDYVIIGQHPGGQEAQLAFGEVVEFPRSGMRYRYNATTRGGSSGSPVFTFDLGLIGLHHAADPASNPKYNQAVPIWKVLKSLKDAGLDLAEL